MSEPFEYEIAFMVYGFVGKKPVCLKIFEDAEEAYLFAAEQPAGVVVPGTLVRKKEVEDTENPPLNMPFTVQTSTEMEEIDQ